jgi:hypothetical protein
LLQFKLWWGACKTQIGRKNKKEIRLNGFKMNKWLGEDLPPIKIARNNIPLRNVHESMQGFGGNFFMFIRKLLIRRK